MTLDFELSGRRTLVVTGPEYVIYAETVPTA